MDPYAPSDVIQRLTKRRYKPAQRRALERMGIPFTRADDGEPLVLWANIPGHTNRERTQHERPRFDLI